ncbi:unnamed protein product, partial [Scytosiphon promiscuus]
MGFKATLKGAVLAGMMAAFGAGAAMAQAACEETQFSSKTGETYLKAEQAAMTNKDFNAAAQALGQLKAMELNCYEEGAVLKLSAYINIERGDRQGAIRDLMSALDKGYIPAKDAAQTYYNIAQIYLQDENVEKSLEYMQKWQQAGGKPDRQQKWQLAVLYQRVDDFRTAIKWTEEVKRDDGNNYKQEVYDLLIYLYNAVDDKAKPAAVLHQLLVRNPT